MDGFAAYQYELHKQCCFVVCKIAICGNYVSFQLGEITEIRLVKNQMGKSKGFAYVEFKNQVRSEQCYYMERNDFITCHRKYSQSEYRNAVVYSTE